MGAECLRLQHQAAAKDTMIFRNVAKLHAQRHGVIQTGQNHILFCSQSSSTHQSTTRPTRLRQWRVKECSLSVRLSLSASLFVRYINHFALFYGAFVQLRKATISFVMSAHPHRNTQLPLDGFRGGIPFLNFPEICRENSRFINI